MLGLDSLIKQGLQLKPLKCEIFRQELIYLGHSVSKNSLQTDPREV